MSELPPHLTFRLDQSDPQKMCNALAEMLAAAGAVSPAFTETPHTPGGENWISADGRVVLVRMYDIMTDTFKFAAWTAPVTVSVARS